MDKKFPTVWEKMPENLRGDFLTHTVYMYVMYFAVIFIRVIFNVPAASLSRTLIFHLLYYQINRQISGLIDFLLDSVSNNRTDRRLLITAEAETALFDRAISKRQAHLFCGTLNRRELQKTCQLND